MDGREQLRRYLEQRREAGEREFFLDGLTVDDALRLVGARGVAPPAQTPPEVPAPGVDSVDRGTADWRSVLAGAQPRKTDAVAPPRMPTRPSAPARPRGDEPPVSSTAAGQADTATGAERDVGVRRGSDATTGAQSRGPVAEGPESPPSAPWRAGLVVGRAHGELFGGPLASLQTIDDLARAVDSCTRCPLYGTATRAVPGEGSATASLVCVGEAPGASEDATGRPFVGQAGKLLDKILAAIQLERGDVFICNVLKHRPPGNRNPLPDEVAACSPYLVRQLELIQPKVIIAFGTFAAQTLLATKDSIGKLRGAVHRYYGVPLIVTYHPAALLRNPAWKRPTWEDVQYARRILDGTGV